MMDCCFQIHPYDVEALRPQVSRALEKRTELRSRKSVPGLWKITDRFRTMGKAPEGVLNRRRRRGRLWSAACLALGIFLLVPGLMDPESLWLLAAVGAVDIVWGAVSLWMGRKRRVRANPFDKSAGALLQGKDRIPLGTVQAVFSEAGMTIADAEREETVPYSDFECCVETEDILLFVYQERATVLQKRDLAAGDLDSLRDFLSARFAWEFSRAQDTVYK